MATGVPRLVTATVVSREFRAPGFWCVKLRCAHIAQQARPAQYVALDIPGSFAVRLPLGIYTVEGDTFGLLFQKWGDRTARFAALREGESISCIGPLGNAFSLPSAGERATIVAGGLGVAPFWLLARELRAAGVAATIVLGARSSDLLVGVEELSAFSFPVELCTDDGSAGFAGNVVERLRTLPGLGRLYGCGPQAMLRSLCSFARAANIPCQLSLEETFGCSMGTCWGCVVPVRRGAAQSTGYPKAARERREYDFARVCAEGTVFHAADLIWS
jgi:dihydroorotate dehydrogenase electron transfer subunit